MTAGDSAAWGRLSAWNRTGRTATLIRPLARVAARLREAGYTVYGVGNQKHMLADPPEDHTPYSKTGYPGTATYGRLYAIDVMPPPPGRGLPSLQQLGEQLVADRKAGHPGAGWLKYINREPDGDYTGRCWNESWMPGYRQISSNDRGHLHLSAYTGMDESPIADTYDLLARTLGEDDMDLNDKIGAGTGHDGRTVGDVFRDVAKMREWLIAPPGTRGLPFVPPPGSALHSLERLPAIEQKLAAVEQKLDRLIAALEAEK